jgi:hypothetical protein
MPVRPASLAFVASAVFISAWVAPAVQSAPSRTPREIASPITDHFAVRGIYYKPSLTTDGRFDSDAGTPGTLFSGEDDLGLNDEANQGRMELLLRMNERHRVRVDYLKLDRFGANTLTRQINYRNSTYNIGDIVETDLNWRMLGLSYTWSALRRERFEIGVGLGLHFVEAQAKSEIRARNISEDGSGVGVLPTLALDGTWRISKRWAVTGHAQYLAVSSTDVDGSFADYHLDVQYRWRRNLAIGLGYSAIKLDADIDSDDLPGSLVLDASGPELFFRVSF